MPLKGGLGGDFRLFSAPAQRRSTGSQGRQKPDKPSFAIRPGRRYPLAMANPDFVLSLSCPDRRGIVAEVSRFLFERNCNILDSQQFGDRANGRFFMRVHGLSEGGISIPALEQAFAAIAQAF